LHQEVVHADGCHVDQRRIGDLEVLHSDTVESEEVVPPLDEGVVDASSLEVIKGLSDCHGVVGVVPNGNVRLKS
jgi:hypothetical protein